MDYGGKMTVAQLLMIGVSAEVISLCDHIMFN